MGNEDVKKRTAADCVVVEEFLSEWSEPDFGVVPDLVDLMEGDPEQSFVVPAEEVDERS